MQQSFDELPPGAEIISPAADAAAEEDGLPPGAEIIRAPDEPGLIESGLEMVTSAGKAVASIFPDSSKMEPQDRNLPEIGSQPFLFGEGPGSSQLTPKQSSQIGAGMFLTTDEGKQAQIIQNAVPGTEVRRDKFNNVLVKFPKGSEFEFLNKPGVSPQDFLQGIGQVATFLPAAALTSGFKTVLGKLAGAFGANAGLSAGQDIGADALAGKGVNPGAINVKKAAVVGLFGTAGEAGGLALARFLRTDVARRFLGQGVTDDQVREIVRAAGLDAENISPQMMEAVRTVAREVSPDELGSIMRGLGFQDDATRATVQGEVLANQFDVPLSRGQSTGNFAQIAREEAMRSDALGEGAGRVMRAFDQEVQAPRLQSAAEDVATRQLPEGAPVPSSTQEAAGVVGEGIRGRSREARQAVSESFEALQDATTASPVTFSGEGFLQFGARAVGRIVEEGFETAANVAPVVHRAISEIEKIAKLVTTPAQRSGPGFLSGASGSPAQQAFNPRTFTQMRTLRRQLTRWRESVRNTDPSQAAALRMIKEDLDDFIFNAADNGLMSGDPAVLRLMREANQGRSQLRELFERSGRFDDIGPLMERITRGGATNVEIGNWLIGAGKVGQSGRAVRFVGRARRVFGEESAEFGSIRAGAVRQLMFANRGGGDVLLGPQAIARNLDDYLRGPGREYSRELHTAEQIAELIHFRELVGRLIPPGRATNPSGTAGAVSRMIQESFSRLAGLVGFQAGGPLAGVAAQQASTVIGRARGTARALQARRGGLPALPAPGKIRIAPAVGSVAKAEEALNDPEIP